MRTRTTLTPRLARPAKGGLLLKALLFALLVQTALASSPAGAPYDRAMERAVRQSDLPRLAVQSEGMEESLASFSRAALSRIIGRMKIRGQDAVYTVVSMVFDAQHWRQAKIIPVDNPQLAHALGFQPGERRFLSLLDVRELTRLHDGSSEAQKLQEQFRDDSDAMRALERLVNRAIYLHRLPQELRILPDENAPPDAQWLSVADLLARAKTSSTAHASTTTAAASVQQMTHAFQSNSPDLIAPAARDFLQHAKPLRGYPSDWKRQMSYLYTAFAPYKWCARFYLLAFLIFLFYVLSKRRSLLRAALALLIVGFILHTLGTAMRYALAGRAPLANMYESIVFAMWGLIGIALILEWKRVPKGRDLRCAPKSGYVGLFASGFAFIVMVAVSFMPLHMTRIEPLRAVLNSAWLTYHVTTVTLSYSAFMLSFLFSAAYLVKDMARAGSVKWLPPKETFDVLNYRAVQIGWPLLTLGIFTGAVWANTAWGRFWGWDPKETWSLITWIIYTIFLHLRITQGWRGRKTAIAAIIGFLAVLMTWFGVSYLPIFHGLHTYA